MISGFCPTALASASISSTGGSTPGSTAFAATQSLDRLFYGASALGDHGLVWLILGALRGVRSDDEHHCKAALRVGAGVGIESVIVNVGIKSLFRRTRPIHEGIRPHKLRTPRTSSFPSGHATSAFTAAALLSDGDELWPALLRRGRGHRQQPGLREDPPRAPTCSPASPSASPSAPLGKRLFRASRSEEALTQG